MRYSPRRLPVDVLDRYFAGTATPEEQLTVERWVAEHPRQATRIFPPPHGVWDASSGYARLQEQIRQDGESTSPRPRKISRILSITGVGIVAACLAAFAWIATRRTPQWQPAERVVEAYQTQAGQRAKIRLNDGTAVTLAPATMLRVTSNGVTVDGEAYFDVAPNASRSFVVRTSRASVEVLGTTFAVRQYPGEKTSQVFVESGKVGVRYIAHDKGASIPTILIANMAGIISDSTIAVTSGSVQNALAWTNGHLTFDRSRLSDVLAELARAYDVDIRVADSGDVQQPITMSVAVDSQPLTEVLDNIGRVTNMHYSRVGRVIRFVPGRVSTRVPPSRQLPTSEKQYGR